MQSANPSYWQTIDTFPNLHLTGLFKQLDFLPACEFIHSLLAGNDEKVIEWLRGITPPVKFRLYSSQEIAIDLFKENDPDWFREHEKIFEQIYSNILFHNTESIDTEVLDNLKGIISFGEGGLSHNFFKSTLKTKSLDPVEETDLLLLWIKLHGIKKFEEIELFLL